MQGPNGNWLRGFFDELTGRFAGKYGGELEALEIRTETEIDSLLERLSPAQLEDLTTTIRERRGLIPVNPAYGNEIISISKQILSFGGAGIGLAAAFSHNLAELPPLILKSIGIAVLFYANLIVLSLFMIFGFVWQSRFRYPFLYFRKIGNTIPFFYYQTISPETPRSMYQTVEEKRFALQLYAADLVRFLKHLLPDTPQPATRGDAGAHSAEVEVTALDNAAECEARLKRRVVRDEAQQYFLLLAYQGYVNQYEVGMNNQFLYGLMASATSAGLVAVYVFASR